MGIWDDDDGGLPDGAFTEDELAAGVQHIMRTGDPDATSSGRRIPWVMESADPEPDPAASSCIAAPLLFATFSEAKTWAQASPGRVIARAADGRGFEAKPERQAPSQGSYAPTAEPTANDMASILPQINPLSPHLHNILKAFWHSDARSHDIQDISGGILERELKRLNLDQLMRLRLLIALLLKDWRDSLEFLEAEMRRFPSMRRGEYGLASNMVLVDFLERALSILAIHISVRNSGDHTH